MEAGRFIKDLLFQADVVVIPRLGAFISTYQSARPDPMGRKISPPAKSFHFDASRIEDDQLISSWIAEQEVISDSEAHLIVDDFVADVQHELQEGREVEIKDLGIFYRDASGLVQFRFSVENNFNADSLGFQDIEILELEHEPLQTEAPTIHVTPSTPVSETVHAAPQPVYTHPPGQSHPPQIHHPPIKKRSYRRVWIGISILLVVTACVFLGIRNKERIGEFTHQWFGRTKPIMSDTLAQKHPSDTGLGKTLSEQAKMKKALDMQSVDSSKIFVPYGMRLMRYYIVAASYNNYDNALKLQGELKSKGFASEIITETHQWYRVTLSSYADKQQALVELEKFQTIMRNDAIWLMHI